ncbi:MAG: hypothetical protein KDD70_07940 [Bdellovibrionales bacterium]|nr:hypothetical protein [Bdellovibrionales bacterium]
MATLDSKDRIPTVALGVAGITLLAGAAFRLGYFRDSNQGETEGVSLALPHDLPMDRGEESRREKGEFRGSLELLDVPFLEKEADRASEHIADSQIEPNKGMERLVELERWLNGTRIEPNGLVEISPLMFEKVATYLTRESYLDEMGHIVSEGQKLNVGELKELLKSESILLPESIQRILDVEGAETNMSELLADAEIKQQLEKFWDDGTGAELWRAYAEGLVADSLLNDSHLVETHYKGLGSLFEPETFYSQVFSHIEKSSPDHPLAKNKEEILGLLAIAIGSPDHWTDADQVRYDNIAGISRGDYLRELLLLKGEEYPLLALAYFAGSVTIERSPDEEQEGK